MASLTANMVKALESASYRAGAAGQRYSDVDAVHTGWSMYGVDGRTLAAMAKRGLCMGDGGLTDAGVSERETLFPAVVVVPAVWETSGPVLETLETIPDCFWACSTPTVRVWFTACGVVEGACAVHAHLVSSVISTDLPVPVPEDAPLSLTGVIQNVPGMWDVEHIHADGCRDIAREMKRYGQKSSDATLYAGMSVADIVEFQDGGRASDNNTEGTLAYWECMLENFNSETRFMPCVQELTMGETPFGPIVEGTHGYEVRADALSIVAELTPDMDAVADALPKVDYSIVTRLTTGAGFHTVPRKAEEILRGISVESAIVGTHSPNSEKWDVSTRTLAPWYPAKSGQAPVPTLALMVDYEPEMWGVYPIENDYVVAAWYLSDGSVLSVFVVDMLSPEQRADAKAFDAVFGGKEMEDTSALPIVETVHLFARVGEGVEIDLGWHTFEFPSGSEQSAEDAYGERHGSGNPRGGWASVIRVAEYA